MNILIIGAGAVGRGLIAPLFGKGHHRITFYDTNARLARALDREGRYPLTIGHPDLWQWVEIAGARHKAAEVLPVMARSDIIFVAVRVGNLPAVAEVLRIGLIKAAQRGRQDGLRIVVCENTPEAAAELAHGLDGDALDAFGARVVDGIAECIIPEPTAEMRRRNALLGYHDPQGYLVVDAQAWGSYPHPGLPPSQERRQGKEHGGIVFEENFALAWDLKWYCHCALHALVAYLGIAAGCTHIHEAMADKELARRVRVVIQKAEERLIAKYPDEQARIHSRIAHEFDVLGDDTRPDPCARVGRDAARKAQKGERLDALLELVGGKNATIEKALEIAKEK